MGKLIAVWGAPNSGKTALSVKLAEAIYSRSRGKSAVIVVFTDIVTPTLPVVFPNFRSEDIYSIGSVLSKPDFFADDVVSNILSIRSKESMETMKSSKQASMGIAEIRNRKRPCKADSVLRRSLLLDSN